MEDDSRTREELLEEVRRLRAALSAKATGGPGIEPAGAHDAEADSRLLLAMVEHAPTPIYVYGVDRRLRYANPAWERLTGLDRRQAIGKRMDDLYSAEVVRDLWAVNRLVAASAMPLNAEELPTTPAGTFALQSVKLPIFDLHGEVEAVGGISIDITARKHMEEELRQARDTLRATIGAAPLAIIATDARGLITVWNPAAERIFGWKADEVLGSPSPHIPEHKLEERQVIVSRILAGEPFLTLETERRHRDGHILDVSLSIAPLHGPGGQVVGAVTILEDISRRRKTETELLEAYRRERMLGENGRSFVVRYSLEPEPRILYVSPSCLAITGFSQQEFFSDPALFYKRIHPEDRDSTADIHGGRHPLANRPMVWRWLTKNDEIIWLERRDVALPAGAGDGATYTEAIVQDVTQRLHSNATLRTKADLQPVLPSSDPVVLLRFRWKGGPRLTWVSDSIRLATGFRAAQFVDDPSFWIERIHPAERSQVLTKLDPQTRGNPSTVRFGWRCHDESYRWFEARRLLHPPIEHEPDEIVVALTVSSAPLREAARPRGPLANTLVASSGSHWKRLLVRLPPVLATRTDRPDSCPKCSATEIVRHDRQVRRIDGGRSEVEVVRYRCRSCGRSFTWHPIGVDHTLQGEALRRLTQVLYGLGLSKRQVSGILAAAGVRLSAGTVWRNARGEGERMRSSLPPGSRCLLPDDPTPTGVDFAIVDRLEVAGPGVPQTTLALLLWDQTGEMLPWLETHLRALGLQCDIASH